MTETPHDAACAPPSGAGTVSGAGHAPVSDEKLLADAARGDGDAFAELFERHARQLRATALRTIRDYTDAEDCLQDAMLRAFQLSPSFRGDCKVGSWLHRIVVNRCAEAICAVQRLLDASSVRSQSAAA